MDLSELRVWLAKKLAREDVPDHMWKMLMRDGYANPRISEKDVEAQDLVHEGKRLLEAASGRLRLEAGRGGDVKPPTDYFEIELSDYEKERARTYEDVLARHASLNQGPDGSYPITDWRRNVLGERLPTLAEAHELLESPATRFLQPGHFCEWNIPLIGHEAEVIGYDSGATKPYVDHRLTLKINPPGVTKTVCYSDQREVEFDPEVMDDRWGRYCGRDGDCIRPEERILRHKDRDDLKEKMWIWPGSVLDSLRSMSAHWAKLLGWEEEDMAMWLLSGKPPRFHPLMARAHSKGKGPLTVTLDIHPWVPAETVECNYRWIQNQLFGKEVRPPGERRLAVLRFVEQHIREHGERLSWAQLVKVWNQSCPKKWRFGDRSNFARAYRETLEVVEQRSIYMLRRKSSDAAKRKAKKRREEKEAALKHFWERLSEEVERSKKQDEPS